MLPTKAYAALQEKTDLVPFEFNRRSVGERDILIEIQDVIENGARARIEVTSRIPGTQALSIVSDRNPHPLAATFSFANGADPYVSTLIKVAESGTLRVIVNAEGRLYIATRDVKTTIGGCG